MSLKAELNKPVEEILASPTEVLKYVPTEEEAKASAELIKKLVKAARSMPIYLRQSRRRPHRSEIRHMSTKAAMFLKHWAEANKKEYE